MNGDKFPLWFQNLEESGSGCVGILYKLCTQIAINHPTYSSLMSIYRIAELYLIYKYNEIVVYYGHFGEPYYCRTSNFDDQLGVLCLVKQLYTVSVFLFTIKSSSKASPFSLTKCDGHSNCSGISPGSLQTKMLQNRNSCTFWKLFLV